MKGVKHHLLDVADPKKQFSVAEFKKLATDKLKLINFPIVVGGTGFYIDALSGTELPEVGPNKKLRKELDKNSPEELFRILKKKDPERAKTIDPHNKVRLIRALEIVDALGKVPTLKNKRNNNFIYIGLLPDDLDKRIKKRLTARMPKMIREAQKLHKFGLSYKRMFELGLEYRYLSLLLQKKLTKAQMTEKLFHEIRRYAKRQMTWFKRNKKIKWFEPSEFKKIERYARIALLGD
jgi:tRNA dimethylallyltransferase